jgi:ABC-2 type transport system ATP-binding protein
LQEVEAMASRVVMIYEGRLVYDGDVETLRGLGDGDLDQAFYALTRDDAA